MKNYTLLITLVVTNFLIGYFTKQLLNGDELLINFYSEQLAQEQLNELIENQQKWTWLSYVIIPILVVLRSSLVAMCLSIGNFFYNLNNEEVEYGAEIKFKQFLNITLKAEFVLVLVGVFKLGYFLFIHTDYTLLDLQQYYPLSYTNFLDLESIEPWLIYPLQTINLFEIGYFFVLVFGMQKLLKNTFGKSFEMVTVSYGTGLLIWLGLVMFLILNNT